MPDLHRLLAPRSIAVVGGAPAERVVRQCLKLGFDGPIWTVNPKRSDLAGISCVPSLADLPGVPDAVFLGINRHATIEAIETVSAMGVGGAVCYSSGFAERADNDLQGELLRAASGMPFFGPNCYGFVNTFDRVALWPDEHGCTRHERGVAIVSQSGNVALNLTFQKRGLRLGTMISVGNQASLGSEDAVAALLTDSRITAIGVYLEAVRDAQRFAEVADLACERGIGLVALQTGRSEAGAQIASSHTGSMAGRAAAYDALFARYGVAVVRTPSEMLETLKLLDHGGRLAGRKIVSLCSSGGEASLVADRGGTTKLRFEPFSAAQQSEIEATVTELVTVSNPFDYHTFMWGDRKAMARTFTAVMNGPQDATILLLDGPNTETHDPSSWYLAGDSFADAAEATGGRAIVVATIAECVDEPFRAHLAQRGLIALLGLSETLAALDAAASVGETSGGHRHAPATAPTSTRLIDEAAAKQRLAKLGIAVPMGRVVANEEVVAAADEIGYPITVKSLGLAHKSEAGAVRIGLPNAEALTSALTAMPRTAAGYLVEATVTDVVAEVLVTVRRDPPIGWLVSIGHGGVTTELWNDVTHLLAPVTTDEVRAALDKLRSASLLHGFRGRPAADVDALVELVARLAEAVVGTDVVEVELNPVLVGRHGAVAVDALLTVEG
ncbi:MAG: acetate--CoA ligase family protein [Ilumatobacteraceae bacterium]